MKIEQILKKLTPERVKKDVKEVMKMKLPSSFFRKWLKEYNKVGQSNRNEYFWKWLYRTVRTVTSPTVEKKYHQSLWNIKLLMLMFVTLFDDISDKYGVRNKKLLNELVKIPFEYASINFNQLNQKEREYIKFTSKIWHSIKNALKKYPRYKEFKDIFEFDVLQLLNAMKYAYLVNENHHLINKIEYWNYSSHNMQAIISCTLDLMCSPKFDIRALGIMRELAWQAQKMARIGNWVSTWEREVKEKDFTSGVFANVIESGVLAVDELEKGDELEIIKKIKDAKIEEKLLKEWEEYYFRIYKLGEKIKDIDVKKILSGLERLIFYHLSSRGYK